MRFFDKQFAMEFRRVMGDVRKVSSGQYNINSLGFKFTPLVEYIREIVEIKDISTDAVYQELNGKIGYLYGAKKIEHGDYAYSNKEETLNVDKDYDVVAITEFIKIPNNYKPTTKDAVYLGYEVLELEEETLYLMLFKVKKTCVYSKPTYTVTASVNKVAKHFGARSLVLLTSNKVYLSIQDRTKMRNTDAKNVLFIAGDVNECLQVIDEEHARLISEGHAFQDSLFEIDDDGFVYNLVYEDFDATMDDFELDSDLSRAEK